MIDEVKIQGIDVTSFRLTWYYEQQWNYAIDSLSLTISTKVNDLIVPAVGNSVTVKRGFVSVSEDFVFEGQITQVQPAVDKVICVCKGRLYDAIKNARTKSWDINIDTEQGVGSEIFKSICDHNSFAYDDNTIVSTGTDTIHKIVKFIQRDEDDYEKMNELADTYNYTILYNPNDSKVYFQPKGFITYSRTLTVGQDIPGQIGWKYNMEQMVNKVKVLGATVYDKVVETFAPPSTSFVLMKTPEDTEVRQDSETGTLYVRGQKNVGTIGVDFDYYIDVELKTIYFSSVKSNIWVRYGSQVPMPVVLTDTSSINLYGGPNLIPHYKTFTYTDIKDINDATNRGREILKRYSLPFIEAQQIPIITSTIQTYGFIKPGYMVNIVDPLNDINVNVLVKIVNKSWPHVTDTITVGDEIWRTENWQNETMKKINQIINELQKNQDTIINVEDNNIAMSYEPQYLFVQKKIGADAWYISQVYMSKQIYKEYFTNTGRINLSDTNATVDTTNHQVVF